MALRIPSRPALAAALAAVAAGASALGWALADDSPQAGTDAYGYMAALLDFLQAAPWPEGPRAALAGLSMGGRPPLFQLAAWPWVALFGGGEDVFVASQLGWLALLAAATYALGRRAAGPWAGALATALAVSYPPVVHHLHGFFPHFAAAACGAWSLALLAGLLERRAPGRAALLGVSLGLGMLVHPSFLWAVAVPVAVFGLWMAWKPGPGESDTKPGLAARLGRPFVVRGLLPGALAALALALPWYATLGRPLLRVQGALTSAALAAYRGAPRIATGFRDAEPDLAWYLATGPRALSWPLAAALVLGFALCLVRLLRPAAAQRPRAGTSVALVAFAGAAALLAVQPTVAWLYGTLALPAGAVVTAAGVAALPRLPRATATGLALAGALLIQLFVPWDGRPAPRTVAALARAAGAESIPPARCRYARGFCAAPPEILRPPIAEALAAIHADPACHREEPCRLLVVSGAGADRWLAGYLRARDRPGWRLAIESERSASWGLLFPLDALLAAEFLYFTDLPTLPPPDGTDFRNAAVHLLRTPETPFAAAHREVFGRESPIGRTVLLRRTLPPSIEEVEATAAALVLEERFRFERFLALGRILARDGRTAELAASLAAAEAARPAGLHRDTVTWTLRGLLARPQEAAPAPP